jgi:hypothetical protein
MPNEPRLNGLEVEMKFPDDLIWSYGVTTVKQRINDLLPQTLISLANAGFPKPRLFVDGEYDATQYSMFGNQVTVRYPLVRTFGNWVLSLMELYIREPEADRYAIFQDDLIAYKNLKEYLNNCPYPDKGYLNLFTLKSNQTLAPTDGTHWYLSNQLGRGAVALVFNRPAVLTLLMHPHMIERFQDPDRGWKGIDGAIVETMKKSGYHEWCHNPSLVQHTGTLSSMGNKEHRPAPNFLGEQFDALELLKSC